MELERKRRKKQGLYDKQETADMFIKDLPDIEEFVIVCKNKDGNQVSYSSTNDIVTVLGLLEMGKIHCFGD